MIRTWLGDVTSLLEEEQYRAYYHTVPAYRKEKADKLRFQKDRALSIGAWVLFERMRKAYNLSSEVSFNLSHSGTFVLCSVEDSGDCSVKVGCDIEQVKREERLDVARRFFCGEEYKSILENKVSFYRCWVLKESFMKATRLGMKLGMNEFEIGFGTGVPVLKSKPEKIEGQFYFKEYEWGELPYRIAVCASRDDFAEALQVIKL